MAWLKARFTEPSTWSASANCTLAMAFATMTFFPFWRDLVYVAALLSIVAAIKAEK